MFLKSLQEIFGNLKSIAGGEHYLVITLTQDFEIPIPINAIPLERLKKLVGKQIGIVNIDGHYKIRELK